MSLILYDLPGWLRIDTTTKKVALFTIGDLIILGYKETRAHDTLSTRKSKLCNKHNKKIVISNSLLKKDGVSFRQWNKYTVYVFCAWLYVF